MISLEDYGVNMFSLLISPLGINKILIFVALEVKFPTLTFYEIFVMKHCNNCWQLTQTKERESDEAQTSGRSDVPGHGKVVNRPLLEPEHTKGGKHNSKAKAKKNAKSGTQKQNAGIVD